MMMGDHRGVEVGALDRVFQITARPGGHEHQIAAEGAGDEGEGGPAGGHHPHQHAEGPPQEPPFQPDHHAVEQGRQQDVHKAGQAQRVGQHADHGDPQRGQQDLGQVVEHRLGGGVAGRPVGENDGGDGDGEKEHPQQKQFAPQHKQRQAAAEHPEAVERHDAQQLAQPEAELGQARHHAHRHRGDEQGAEKQKCQVRHSDRSSSQ